MQKVNLELIQLFPNPHSPNDLDEGYSGEYKSSRFRVDSIGGHGSRLTVRDYRATVDNGVYRCFAERYDSDRDGEERSAGKGCTLQRARGLYSMMTSSTPLSMQIFKNLLIFA